MIRITCTSTKILTWLPETGQPVRWLRKPRKPLWMPMAKSKLFKIPVKPTLPEEEYEELKRLFNNYRTQMKSIRKFLTNKYSVRLQAQADTEQIAKAFEEDFARCSQLNDRWNTELRKLRDERVAKELEADVEFALNRMEQLKVQQAQQLEEAEEVVRREKSLVGGFVTPETLDEVVARALDTPVDHNFAIDLEGNRIVGREGKPDVSPVP